MVTNGVTIASGALSKRTLAIDDHVRPGQLLHFGDGSHGAPHRRYHSSRPILLTHCTVVEPLIEILVHGGPKCHSFQGLPRRTLRPMGLQERHMSSLEGISSPRYITPFGSNELRRYRGRRHHWHPNDCLRHHDPPLEDSIYWTESVIRVIANLLRITLQSGSLQGSFNFFERLLRIRARLLSSTELLPKLPLRSRQHIRKRAGRT